MHACTHACTAHLTTYFCLNEQKWLIYWNIPLSFQTPSVHSSLLQIYRVCSAANCFRRSPPVCALEHRQWVLCGHWVHLISNLTTASGGVTFLLRKRRPSPVPHGSLRLAFQGMLFPPWTKHITLLFCGKNPRMWVNTWVGSCPVLIADLTFSGRHSCTILYRSREIWRGTGSGRKVWSLIQHRNIGLWFHIL